MMHFENIDQSHKYLEDVFKIIRSGIATQKQYLRKRDNEGIKTQTLVDEFNYLGTSGEITADWIGVQKENIHENDSSREDIYFYLHDEANTRIFYAEAKRLPKNKTKNKEEYVIGTSTTGEPSGGIERYKLGKHGQHHRHNGMIAYVENKSIEEWAEIINRKIDREYSGDSLLVSGELENGCTSVHNYIGKEGSFCMHHFWINLI
jgi:hypothetical protein